MKKINAFILLYALLFGFAEPALAAKKTPTPKKVDVYLHIDDDSRESVVKVELNLKSGKVKTVRSKRLTAKQVKALAVVPADTKKAGGKTAKAKTRSAKPATEKVGSDKNENVAPVGLLATDNNSSLTSDSKDNKPSLASPIPTPVKETYGDPKHQPAKKANKKTRAASDRSKIMGLLFFTFALAIFLGFELISRVPSQLHTPLMSGSNAISGISIVGALLATGLMGNAKLSVFLGFLAVVFASINVVGGYLVTDRMLAMFKKKGGA